MNLEALREKKEKIKKQNEQLKKLNYKLEALLVSIDTYSIPESLIKEQKKLLTNYKNLNIKELDSINISSQINTIKNNVKDFKTYHENDFINEYNKIKNNCEDNLNENFNKIDISFLDQDTSFNTCQNTSLLMDSKNIFLHRISSDTNLKKANKGHILKIVNLLYENKKGLPWEEIIQKSGVPKYKCIEILNNMVKSNPPVLIKKRDKGFTCYLNI